MGRRDGILALAAGLLLLVYAAWTYDFLGADLFEPVQHGRNEDWDWQLALWEATRKSILDFGELPLWNPWVQGGVPLWGNPECPVLYPGFWLVMPLETGAGLKLLVLLHLALLVVGGWVGGREAGLGPVAAHSGAAFLLGSAFLPEFITAGHVMYLPLGFLPLAWVAFRRGRWRLAAGLLALPMLAGGHYLLLYGALWLAADAAFRALDPGRLRWLAPPLVLNGLALGVDALAWPLGLALVVAILAQRPKDAGPLKDLALCGLVCAGLLCVKVLPALPLFERAERLVAQRSFAIADPYTLLDAARVLGGVVERPSGHEGQNSFLDGLAPILGLGLGWAAWRQPRWGLLGLLFWNLGWSGPTPVDLAELLHRLPGYSQIRVVERYSLIWTLFLGWGAGSIPWLAALVPVHLARVATRVRALMALGAGPDPDAVPPGDFVQARDEQITSFQSIRANQGRVDLWTTAWLRDPSPALQAASDDDFRGMVWTDAGPARATFTPNTVTVWLEQPGVVRVDMNAFEGWAVDGAAAVADQGLLSAQLPAGETTFRYVSPWLGLGAALSTLTAAITLLSLRSQRPSSSISAV